MRKLHMSFTLLGLLALTACATTTPGPSPLEIPLPARLLAPCEQLSIPTESELPPLAEGEGGQAQLVERRWWGNRDTSHEGVERRLCRQRDEAVALIAAHNQIVRQEE